VIVIATACLTACVMLSDNYVLKQEFIILFMEPPQILSCKYDFASISMTCSTLFDSHSANHQLACTL